jgi:hypothetical protein
MGGSARVKGKRQATQLGSVCGANGGLGGSEGDVLIVLAVLALGSRRKDRP